jgi:RimJ/RimL family protein N-acetyltransferase
VKQRAWPLFALRLTTPDLTLRPMTEADLPLLAELYPADVEQDPATTRYPGLDEGANRASGVFQTYWRYYGTWSPTAWRLNFVVHAGGSVVGVQELEGNDFPMLRTVDSSSWLVESARGRGLGKQMRGAVLTLAFGELAAEAAITSAWHDNHASLGVSRSLGYEPNGVELMRRGDGVDRLEHLRLRRSSWLARGAEDVVVSGFGPCRAYFGL